MRKSDHNRIENGGVGMIRLESAESERLQYRTIVVFQIQIRKFSIPNQRVLIRLLTNFDRAWSYQERQYKLGMCDGGLTQDMV